MRNPIINIDIASNIIASLPKNEFNSHEFIKAFTDENPQIYNAIVARYRGNAIKIANQQIGSYLLYFSRWFTPRIEKVGTIRHNNSTCAEWRKE